MSAPRRNSVTVVSGIPRSGTSLVMQMLRAGGLPLLCDARRPPDVHNPRGYFEYEPVRRSREDASWLAQAAGRGVKVVHALVAELPEGPAYRLVLLHRDLREVVASQAAMLAGRAPPGPSSERLVEIFAAQLAELERRLAARRDFRVLHLEHRQLLAEPRRAAALLADFVGAGLDPEAMAAAVDPSLYRTRLCSEP